MVGIISVVIGGHFGGGDHFDDGDHFGGGTVGRIGLAKFHRKLSYSMGIDSAERFVFSFMYLNAQFRTKTQFTFRMKKVESSLLVRLH